MSNTVTRNTTLAPARRTGSPLAPLARRLLLRQLRQLQAGEIEVVDRDGRWVFGRTTDDCPLRGTVLVHDPRFYVGVLLGGTVGAGEAYMRGYWSADDLTTVVRILARNADLGDRIERGAWLRRPIRKLAHRLRSNTRPGSRRNIASHYDLGNEFFSLFLDDTMMYSCAVFEGEGRTLSEASRFKLDLICRKLDLTAETEVLEIGTGWGGFALHAARRYGCRVTTTTISEKQYDYTVRRVRDAGLDDRVNVLRLDYRDLPGALRRRFDRVVSVEMIEAIGHRNFDHYFHVCSELLRPEGAMLLQAIVIDDRQFESYKRGVDFIQRYIFPGGCLPSVSAMCGSIARATELRVTHLQDITPHYAETLRHWRRNFNDNLEKIRALGCSEEFLRMWEFYLCYCEGGFRERAVGDVQMVLAKPLNREEVGA